ncbi:MAG: cytochrome c [Saprospiraceae bacterium]|jgi:mono/diheme cytochrome c family protein|nr:cytochrome c [Saprospiraceae bacterium]
MQSKSYNFGLVSLALFALFAGGLVSCSKAGGNQSGHEFMPDMAHSVAYEANVYFDYGLNTWEKESVLGRKGLAAPRNPIKGTIARGYAGTNNGDMLSGAFNQNAIYTPANGAVPYYYADTPEDRLLATAQIVKNPFPITEKGLAIGKDLYTINCAICHGDKGDGAGYLVRDDGGVYPAQPANLISDPFISSSEGRFYHSIMYGLNVMGSYADKLSYEERWQVIHYIRSLQAQAKGMAYNENENALNTSAIPVSGMATVDTANVVKPN